MIFQQNNTSFWFFLFLLTCADFFSKCSQHPYFNSTKYRQYFIHTHPTLWLDFWASPHTFAHRLTCCTSNNHSSQQISLNACNPLKILDASKKQQQQQNVIYFWELDNDAMQKKQHQAEKCCEKKNTKQKCCKKYPLLPHKKQRIHPQLSQSSNTISSLVEQKSARELWRFPTRIQPRPKQYLLTPQQYQALLTQCRYSLKPMCSWNMRGVLIWPMLNGQQTHQVFLQVWCIFYAS